MSALDRLIAAGNVLAEAAGQHWDAGPMERAQEEWEAACAAAQEPDDGDREQPGSLAKRRLGVIDGLAAKVAERDDVLDRIHRATRGGSAAAQCQRIYEILGETGRPVR